MEILLNVLWTLFWPWTVIAVLVWVLVRAHQVDCALREKLSQTETELEQIKTQYASLNERSSKCVRKLEATIEELREEVRGHRADVEKAKRTSLESLLGLKGGA